MSGSPRRRRTVRRAILLLFVGGTLAHALWVRSGEHAAGPLDTLVPADVECAIAGRLRDVIAHPIGETLGITRASVDRHLDAAAARAPMRVDVETARRECVEGELLFALRDDEVLALIRWNDAARELREVFAAPLSRLEAFSATVDGRTIRVQREGEPATFFAEHGDVLLASSSNELLNEALDLPAGSRPSLADAAGPERGLFAQRSETAAIRAWGTSEFLDDLVYHAGRDSAADWLADVVPPDELSAFALSAHLDDGTMRVELDATRRVGGDGSHQAVAPLDPPGALAFSGSSTRSGHIWLDRVATALARTARTAPSRDAATDGLASLLGDGVAITVSRLPQSDQLDPESRDADAPRPFPGMILRYDIREGVEREVLEERLAASWKAIAGRAATLRRSQHVLYLEGAPWDDSHALLTPAATISDRHLALASNARLLWRAEANPRRRVPTEHVSRAEFDFGEIRRMLLDTRGVEARELLHSDLSQLRPMIERRVRVKRRGEGLSGVALTRAVDEELAVYRGRIDEHEFPAMIAAEKERWAFLDDWDNGELRIEEEGDRVRVTLDIRFR